MGKIQYILGQRGITVLQSTYTEKVVLEVLVPKEEEEVLTGEIVEGTNGQALIEKGEECYFAKIDGEMVIFQGVEGDNIWKLKHIAMYVKKTWSGRESF